MLRLETRRMILRDYTVGDETAILKLKSNPETMFYLPGMRLNSLEEAKADLCHVCWIRQLRNVTPFFFTWSQKQPLRLLEASATRLSKIRR